MTADDNIGGRAYRHSAIVIINEIAGRKGSATASTALAIAQIRAILYVGDQLDILNQTMEEK